MTDFVALEDLLQCQRESDQPQAQRRGELLNWQQWQSRVGQWRARLAEEPGRCWALFDHDAFEFSAALFALWASGKVACVPGSNQPLVVSKLAERVEGFIGDFAGAAESIEAATDLTPDLSPLSLDRQQLAMEIFTSGSSGEPQAIPKQLYQLSEEVSRLERLWGALAQGSVTAGTVSHHHIYGLLFRVLWPLAAGRLFSSSLNEYLEELNDPAQADQPLLLISSPSHLSRIPEQTDWSHLRRRCRAIFSSGAPLPREASISAHQLLGQAPIEVFGSSETGGIAYRQQAVDKEVPWQPVPDLQLAVDDETQCLKIRSPYLPPMTAGQWYLTSDRVRIDGDGRFQLCGRADRIAKVEGKRVSLSEMEQRLQSHPLVSAARVLVLAGKRSEMAAVVVLSEAGRGQLAAQGRRPINSQLGEFLLQQFERPVLPRRWRYPEQLPLDSQGKATQANLAALFAEPGQARPLFPELVASERNGDTLRLTLRVPADLFYFEGHFPVAPILPGVVQLKWAQHYGRELLGFAGDFSHLEAVKFQHVLRPDQEVELELKHSPGKNKLSFRYQSAAGQHASGRIVNRVPAP